MTKTFIDSDIFLDVILDRKPYAKNSSKIFDQAIYKNISLYTSAVCFANIYYIASKNIGKVKAKKLITEFKTLFEVIPTSDRAIHLAIQSSFTDIEDAIQYYTAVENRLDLIITRNKKHFKQSEIPVLNPTQYLATLI
jgi:predicted nucleic acid-binding protein